jgi:hypothetical protein
MGFPLQLLIMAVFGGICAALASTRGRSPLAWFFIGGLIGCFGLILVLVLPDLKAEEEKERRLATENRRLKERLRKERALADRRHSEAQRRLGAHDQALGVDTGEVLEDAGADALPPLPPGTPDTLAGTLWYYSDRGEQAGPVEFTELRRLYRRERITPETHVWQEGMADWVKIRELDDLQEGLDG